MQIISKTLPLTVRVQKGLEEVEESRLHEKKRWGEGLTVLDEETVKLPLVKRKALAVKKVLSEMPVDIKDYELIVGRILQSSIHNRPAFPEYATEEEKEIAAKKRSGTSSIFGHIEPHYARCLKYGLSGLRKIAEDELAELRSKGNEPEKETWYESVLISLEGLRNLIQRYADLALELAVDETDIKRQEELREIAEICCSLLERPPQTFREALQSFWFFNTANNSIPQLRGPMGRFDQNLWPYLKVDLDNGKITLEEAQELIDLVWLKINERLQLLEFEISTEKKLNVDRANRQFRQFTLGGRTSYDLPGQERINYNQFFSTMALSGLTPEGKDGTSPLTYLCLNATYRLKLVQPEMYVRMHKDSSPELYERSADLIRAGLANPNIFNDEAIVPALMKEGMPVKDAREYTSDGCWEAHAQGKTFFRFGVLSAPECLERTLFPERWWEREVSEYEEEADPFRSVEVPDSYAYHSFDEIMETYKKILDAYIGGFIKAVVMTNDDRLYHIAPLPFFSALVEGPLESGKDVTQGGMTYTQFSAELSGLSHTADSLAVIKKLCFDEKVVDLTELLDATRANWEGKENLRQIVRTRAPAYGNDVNEVDNIAREIVQCYVESVRKHKAEVGTDIMFAPGIATFESYTAYGAMIGATPDGRLAYTPVSSNASPSVGRAVRGQTAAVNSYLKLPNTDLPTAAPLDLAMSSRADLLQQLEAFIKSFIEGKGSLLTISVNDCESLRAAQKEPEKYRDLKVRVGGWEAYFVDLPPIYQKFQIQKCEQYA